MKGLKPSQNYWFGIVATNSRGRRPAGSHSSRPRRRPCGRRRAGDNSRLDDRRGRRDRESRRAPTTYWFEYGTSSFAAATANGSAGSGSGSVSVTAKITGLKPGTAYIFRLVASNSSGSSTGVQSSFTTERRCGADGVDRLGLRRVDDEHDAHRLGEPEQLVDHLLVRVRNDLPATARRRLPSTAARARRRARSAPLSPA